MARKPVEINALWFNALNAMAEAPPGALEHGVVTASAGNMAQGVAWGARERGLPCTVVMIRF